MASKTRGKGKKKSAKYKRAACRDCAAPIKWIAGQNGRYIPADPAPLYYWPSDYGWKWVVTAGGKLVRCELEGKLTRTTPVAWMPHWNTCAAEKDKRNKEVEEQDRKAQRIVARLKKLDEQQRVEEAPADWEQTKL